MIRKILHISDLHFGPPYVDRVGEAAVRIAFELKPDLIVITGDLTQRARIYQFKQAAAYIKSLKKVCENVLVVPGNHDIPLYRFFERLFFPYFLFRKYINQKLDHFFENEGFAVACLNSTRPYSRIKEGKISKRQIDECVVFFRQQPANKVRLVLMHHHIFPVPSFEGFSVVDNAKHLIDSFTALKIDAVCSGHIHRGYVGNSLDVYSGVDRNHGVLAVSCGTTTSRRGRGPEREKNSLNLIEVSDTEVMVAHHMYFSEDDAFRETSRHQFKRPCAE